MTNDYPPTGGEGRPTMATTTTPARCTTCGGTPEAPYRRRDAAGVVTEGCVSAAHDGHGDAWHHRRAAEAIRAQPKAWADLA